MHELRAHVNTHVMASLLCLRAVACLPPLLLSAGSDQCCCVCVLWSLAGDNRCFLFSISPSMAVYTSTGYNNHYMYLNHGQQTIPNGLVRPGEGLGASIRWSQS